MTTERDPRTRIVLSWLREDTHENAERVLLLALDEVDTTPQRRRLWPAWRFTGMTRLAMAAAAVLVVAVLGYNLIPGLRILGPGGTGGGLPLGPHVMDPVDGEHGEDRVTVTISAPGWFARDSGSLTKDLGGGDRVTVVVVPGDYYKLPRSICNWRIEDVDQREDDMPATADGFLDALAAQTYDLPDESLTRAFSTPEDVTISHVNGQRIVQTVREYPESDANACDEQRFCTLKDRDGWECLMSHPEPGALDTLWVVDPNQTRIYLLVVAASGSPSPGLREEMNTLVSSMTFYDE